MSQLSGSWTIDIGFLVLSVILVIYVYYDYVFKHWKRRGIPYKKPIIFVGNLGQSVLQRKHMCDDQKDIYQFFEGERFAGIFLFSKPVLIIRDLDLVKNIIIKDFEYFHDHDFKLHEDLDPLMAKTLFAARGKRWRELRVKMTPTFTSGKMKKMFHLMVKCAYQLNTYLETVAEKGKEIEMKDILSRMTSDIIGSCAMGIDCNSIKDPKSEFLEMGKRVFKSSSKLSQLKFMIILFVPALANVFRVRFVEKPVDKFFRNAVKENIEYRAKHNIVRNDFIDLLLELKKKGHVDVDESELQEDEIQPLGESNATEISDEELAAQVLSFFSAGFETSASTISLALYELAVNPDIQETLQAEIDRISSKHGGQITYEGIQEMHYLDKVVSETLRIYSPGMILGRECAKDYRIPGTDIIIEKGTAVQVPIYGIHHDPKYYPNPEKFDPERFSEENKKKRPNFSYLPFGEGPRICIGMRFALLTVKVGLSVLLSEYEVQVSGRTPVPMKLDPTQLMLQPKGGNWLKVVKRRKNSS